MTPSDRDRSASDTQPSPSELHEMWSLHRLQSPTFDDLTRGLCLGLVWCMAMWTPMFLSALT
ncbi:hypothetical protein [Azospirillum picis]|uniref:Uncharacterized protein n=1 Tax=Azospirillum picis TaxID=488438 RepID=A0ABU0MIW8_9PROT|nr:hypothetical protein [Azospirillum picis]MBP2299635.1 hypothetical protein [Azospirillum picis]MDQ0533238.1 hypothetical protein [Azospirillum picis]